jgi:enoyl-[acyl-carrier protein] reductase I
MGFLTGKKLLITGVLSNRSIAYGIARPATPAGRRAGLQLRRRALQGPHHRIRRRVRLQAGVRLRRRQRRADRAHVPRPVAALADVRRLRARIGFAPREAIAGNFLDGLSRENFRIAHDISAYSFPAMAKAALPYLSDASALLTLSYLGALRSIPNYNTMGLAKASLEASVRYLAEALGAPTAHARQRHQRRPDQDAGGQRHQGLRQAAGRVADAAPLRRNVTIDDVGNVAAFLMSDLASGVTAEITYVDGGFSQTAGLSADQV